MDGTKKLSEADLPKILDVLIIGAGLSGIDAAYRIQSLCKHKTLAILESRARIGGTWDLFRYPGVRSDSDIETLGFPFNPWTDPKSIADGSAIQKYIEDTAQKFGLYSKIHFGWKALEARWLEKEGLWKISCVHESQNKMEISCRFLYCCTGYYSYQEAHQPVWPGQEKFKGQFIHPQFWPANFSETNKNIVVIGSGATAVTLIPSLADKAKSVTMLQRSPTYVVSIPAVDPLSQKIKSLLPAAPAHTLIRLKNIIYSILVFQYAKRRPIATRKAIKKMAEKQLPRSFETNKHFNPSYSPWDQRLCLTPDGDFFSAIKSGKADVVTDEISSFQDTGIQLKSGNFIEADVVISATGLKLKLLGGIKLYLGDSKIELNEHYSYKGILLSDIPNFAMAIGYTNASWTLKCDLGAKYVCRLLNSMDSHGYDVVRATAVRPIVSEPLLNLTSSYIKRDEKILPKQGQQKPWKLYQNYFLDWLTLGFSPIKDRELKFSSRPKAKPGPGAALFKIFD